MFGIYVHIPFCVAKCNYCSFISRCANENEIEEYIAQLINEIKASSTKYNNEEILNTAFDLRAYAIAAEENIDSVFINK